MRARLHLGRFCIGGDPKPISKWSRDLTPSLTSCEKIIKFNSFPGATPKRNAGPFPERGRSPSGGKGPALRFSRPPTLLIPHGNGSVPSRVRLCG